MEKKKGLRIFYYINKAVDRAKNFFISYEIIFKKKIAYNAIFKNLLTSVISLKFLFEILKKQFLTLDWVYFVVFERVILTKRKNHPKFIPFKMYYCAYFNENLLKFLNSIDIKISRATMIMKVYEIY